MSYCNLVEQTDLQRPFNFEVGPQSRPKRFQDSFDENVVILRKAFENREKGVSMLLQERGFDMKGRIFVYKAEKESDI